MRQWILLLLLQVAWSFITTTTTTTTTISPGRCRNFIYKALNQCSSSCIRSNCFAIRNDVSHDDDDDEDYDEDDDDYDEPKVRPYRNRSLAWTLRYRKLNPYITARARVINFGMRSKEDWDDAMSSGQLGQYVPSYPDEMYASEWTSWEEWLGLMRTYNETQNLAKNVLGLKCLDDYLLFVKGNSKRAEGLRIPVRPDLYYEDEWIDEQSFFR